MLGGIEVTSRAREHARDMLAGAAAPGPTATATHASAANTVRVRGAPVVRKR